MPATFSAPSPTAIPIDVIESDQLDEFKKRASADTMAWVKANGFNGKLGQVLCVPLDGCIARVLVGWGRASDRAR